jgi:hypothetical protein
MCISATDNERIEIFVAPAPKTAASLRAARCARRYGSIGRDAGRYDHARACSACSLMKKADVFEFFRRLAGA